MKSQDLIPETLDSILEGILTEEDDEDIFTEDTRSSLSSSRGMASPPPPAVCHTSVIVTNPHSHHQVPPRAERSLLAEIFICYEKGRLLLKSEDESADSCCSEDSLLVSTF